MLYGSFVGLGDEEPHAACQCKIIKPTYLCRSETSKNRKTGNTVDGFVCDNMKKKTWQAVC